MGLKMKFYVFRKKRIISVLVELRNVKYSSSAQKMTHLPLDPF